MAHFSFTDGVATLNAVNLSIHCVSIDVEGETRTVEDGPSMGQTDAKFLPVVKVANLRVRFKQDFAGAAVHATLWPLWSNKTTFAYAFRPTSAAISSTNPEFQGSGFITRYQPVRGAFGEVPEVEIEIMPTTGITEDTTP